MEKKYDVIALGELLIDFTMNGKSEQGNNLFEACPGGAPCNVLALLNKMGKKTAFIGKVGKDQFGTLLRETITEVKSDVIMPKQCTTAKPRTGPEPKISKAIPAIKLVTLESTIVANAMP